MHVRMRRGLQTRCDHGKRERENGIKRTLVRSSAASLHKSRYRMSQVEYRAPPSKAAAARGNASRSTLRKRIGSKLISCGRIVVNVPRRLRDATGTFFKYMWRGGVDEERKVVLKRGLKRALFRCSIHLLTVSATTTIAYFNLAGYFIGSELQGLTGGVYQALDILCLQVTAKLLVIAFIAIIPH